jgi:hypothetical protein
MKATVWACVIENRGGISTTLFRTDQEAHNHVAAYVDEWWAEEMDPDQERPVDAEAMVIEYFQFVEGEYVSIEEVDLPDGFVDTTKEVAA